MCFAPAHERGALARDTKSHSSRPRVWRNATSVRVHAGTRASDCPGGRGRTQCANAFQGRDSIESQLRPHTPTPMRPSESRPQTHLELEPTRVSRRENLRYSKCRMIDSDSGSPRHRVVGSSRPDTGFEAASATGMGIALRLGSVWRDLGPEGGCLRLGPQHRVHHCSGTLEHRDNPAVVIRIGSFSTCIDSISQMIDRFKHCSESSAGLTTATDFDLPLCGPYR